MIANHNGKSFRSPKMFEMLLTQLAPLTFLIRDLAFCDPLRRQILHVQILVNDGPKPLT